MDYKEIIRGILSDGNWHCINSIILETGTSARNRISEMNIAAEKELGRRIIDGAPCDLDGHNHRSRVFKYRNAQHEEKEYMMQTFDDLIALDL